MFNFQQKILYTKKQEYDPYTGEKQSIETISEEAQKLALLNRDFKSPIINMYKELKETLPKYLK